MSLLGAFASRARRWLKRVGRLELKKFLTRNQNRTTVSALKGSTMQRQVSRIAVGVLACLAVVGLPAWAANEIPVIPVSVTDIRFAHGKPSLTFVLRNEGPEKLIAWSVWIVLQYPDGSTAKKGLTTHCHTASSQPLVKECEIEPGRLRKLGPVYFTLRSGQLPVTATASVLSAVFETKGKSGERWVGNQDLIEPLLKDHAERQRTWKAILLVLEGGGEQDEDPLQAAYERLGREGPESNLSDMVRNYLARAIARRSQGRGETVDPLQLMIRTARAQSSGRAPHVPK